MENEYYFVTSGVVIAPYSGLGYLRNKTTYFAVGSGTSELRKFSDTYLGPRQQPQIHVTEKEITETYKKYNWLKTVEQEHKKITTVADSWTLLNTLWGSPTNIKVFQRKFWNLTSLISWSFLKISYQ